MDNLTKGEAALADKAYDADERVKKKLRDKGCSFLPKRAELIQLTIIKIFDKERHL